MAVPPISFRLGSEELHGRLEARATRHGETAGQYVKRTMERALVAAECPHADVSEAVVLVCRACGRQVSPLEAAAATAGPRYPVYDGPCAHGSSKVISSSTPLQRCDGCGAVEGIDGKWRVVA